MISKINYDDNDEKTDPKKYDKYEKNGSSYSTRVDKNDYRNSEL